MDLEGLKTLAKLTGKRLPARKGDLALLFLRHRDGGRLHTFFQGLDDLRRSLLWSPRDGLSCNLR